MKDVAIRRRKNFVVKNFWESESTKEKKVECLEFSWVFETAIKAILQVWQFCRGEEMTKRKWYQIFNLYLTNNSELLKSMFCKRLTFSSGCNQWTPLSFRQFCRSQRWSKLHTMNPINSIIQTLVLISDADGDADGVHVLCKLALNFDQVILCVTKSFNSLGRKTWTYKNKSQTCQWEWEVTVCIGRNRYFKQANSKRKSNIWECVSIITFFRIPTVFQTRLLMDGMWIIKWYIKHVCCLLFLRRW